MRGSPTAAAWSPPSRTKATTYPPDHGPRGLRITRGGGMAAVRPHTTKDATTIDFRVEGMTCGSCAARVQRVLAKTDGVAHAEVNLATGRAHVTLQRPLPAADLQARVAKIGYGLTPLAEPPHGSDDPEERTRRPRPRRAILLAPAA